MRANSIVPLHQEAVNQNRLSPSNTQNRREIALQPAALRLAEIKLGPPIVAGELLSGGKISFLEFLADEICRNYCETLFGTCRSAAASMLDEFRKATEFHYYGHRRPKPGCKKPNNPGKLTETKATTKKLLKSFARLAYRGDPDRRGVVFWERVAWLLWEAYAALMALRARAEKIKRQENERIARLAAKRAKRASYMRRYREKRVETARKAQDI